MNLDFYQTCHVNYNQSENTRDTTRYRTGKKAIYLPEYQRTLIVD